MTFGLGDCTPVPTVVTGADGEPRVVYGGCPTEVVDVTTDGTVVYHDQITGKVTVSQHSDLMLYALLAAGVFGLVALSRR